MSSAQPATWPAPPTRRTPVPLTPWGVGARVVGIVLLVAGAAYPWVRLAMGGTDALMFSLLCLAGQGVACLTGEIVTAWIVRPVVAGAVAISAGVGALVDSRRRPTTALVMAGVGVAAIVVTWVVL
ncbi:putative serine-threonine protein kinase [Beutenbergia cavernae DSM 12333]|uniref:Putative serine-threonine protein kinase n=1 Tax=Beutenbergia cavernae (strain ATCC BAA-8 / DSM 12333 / CCUG 43141 / JCM 11478 / NBRC 16432 / NCIMB 13614 / HKI 0122) TaxID=471853 RepID=C5C2E7_BEUC1|nr:hypothetical protein [Beutenbergia cavernae]ACQ79633.1 putative serine-threonine protein kinase [Beutenbergia cavernae DSM 12333]